MIGTTGFIPPELFSGREPTKASDLYSLGATLLSLITGTPSTQMDRLLGDDFRFSDAAYEAVDRPYSNWLRKMTAVRMRDRFADAASALEGLDVALNPKLVNIISISSPVSSKHRSDSKVSDISPLIKASAIFLVQIFIANSLLTILTGMSIPAALTQVIHTLQGVGYKQD